MSRSHEVPIDRIDSAVFTVPTDAPEEDGTLRWTSTTIVVVHAHAGGTRGMGYSYTHAAAARLIDELLGPAVQGMDAFAIPAAWAVMNRAVRNLGKPGLAATAISAIDTALWDLKARLLEVPLVTLLGSHSEEVLIYGSGGFTSYAEDRLIQQLEGWAAEGIHLLKMKVGREPTRDIERVQNVRRAIGHGPDLFVDANGAYTAKQALKAADVFVECGVTWFEEPVSSDAVETLHFVRTRCPPGLEVAAGEYAYTLHDFRRLLEARSVDVLQADATRCCGFTGFLGAAALCESHGIALSAHCAPALHVHVGCSSGPVRHLEYFHDHVRIENLLFEGVPKQKDGKLRPDRSRLGLGLQLKESEAAKFAV